MAGRNHLQPDVLKFREPPPARAPHPRRAVLIDDPRFLRGLPPPQPPPPAAVIEDRIAAQHREIQTLLVDNQRLAASHVALKQELAAVQQELRHLSAVAADVKTDRDAQVRELYERSIKIEVELRSIDAQKAELAEVRADIQKLSAAKNELTEKLKAIDVDIVRSRARSELQEMAEIAAEIEAMRREILRGRSAIEYEKKIRASNLEQSQIMEKNMISMAREIKKLQAELADAEKRARAAAAAAAAAAPGPGYTAGYGNPELGYVGNFYPDQYAIYQVQAGAAAPHYSSGAGFQAPYDA